MTEVYTQMLLDMEVLRKTRDFIKSNSFRKMDECHETVPNF